MTFPSHAAAVLPLKLWRPAWFDGVALVVGSAAPDVPYVLGPPLLTFGHTWLGLLVWGVPLGVVGGWCIRLAAPVVAAHLPGYLRDYGVIGRVRHRWFVTVGSAWLGAVSHRLWDDLTHASLPGTSVGIPALDAQLVPGLPWWAALHALSSTVGLVVWAWLSWYVARRGRLREWHGAPPSAPRAPRLFWSVSAVVAAGGLMATALLPGGQGVSVVGVRLLFALAGGLVVAAVAVQLTARRRATTIPEAGGDG